MVNETADFAIMSQPTSSTTPAVTTPAVTTPATQARSLEEALAQQRPSSAPGASAGGEAEAVEALAWCQEHEARVSWHRAAENGQPRCSIEVLAPGSSWNLLRGRAADFIAAYRVVRGKWSATGPRAAA